MHSVIKVTPELNFYGSMHLASCLASALLCTGMPFRRGSCELYARDVGCLCKRVILSETCVTKVATPILVCLSIISSFVKSFGILESSWLEMWVASVRG